MTWRQSEPKLEEIKADKADRTGLPDPGLMSSPHLPSYSVFPARKAPFRPLPVAEAVSKWLPTVIPHCYSLAAQCGGPGSAT